MIIVRIIGGIGNQLFQYVFGQYLKKQYNIKVLYDISAFDSVNKERDFELRLIFPDIQICNKEKYLIGRYRGFEKRVRVLFFNLRKTNHYIANCEIDNLPEFEGGHIYYLDGYWQYPEIIKTMYENLSNKFIPTELPPIEISRLVEEINFNNSVAIHIRRGDYFTPKNIERYGVCDSSYYNKAVIKMENMIDENLQYYVFSDDLKWVKDNMNLPSNTMYVNNYQINTYWYIYLMSLCNHNIISNSSFSWWGAFINNNPNKKVIAPSIWLLNSKETLALNEWIKI